MIVGSFIAPGTPGTHVQSASVFTLGGIMAKHGLRPQEFVKICRQLYNVKLRDILWSYPDGPRYDIALYLIATSR